MLDNQGTDLNMMRPLIPSTLDENLHQVFDKSPRMGAIDGDKYIYSIFKKIPVITFTPLYGPQICLIQGLPTMI